MEKGDFIEFNYTAKVANGFVFDTTKAEVAKAAGLSNRNYTPAVICLGERQFLEGVEEYLIGKDLGKHTINLSPEKAFGKKDAKLIQTVSASKFSKDNIKPYPGLQVNVDGRIAVVKIVNGGRVLLDFNHPLSGIPVIYEVEVVRKITDLAERVSIYTKHSFGNIKFELKNTTVNLFVKEVPAKEVIENIEQKFKKIIPELTKVDLVKETITTDK